MDKKEIATCSYCGLPVSEPEATKSESSRNRYYCCPGCALLGSYFKIWGVAVLAGIGLVVSAIKWPMGIFLGTGLLAIPLAAVAWRIRPVGFALLDGLVPLGVWLSTFWGPYLIWMEPISYGAFWGVSTIDFSRLVSFYSPVLILLVVNAVHIWEAKSKQSVAREIKRLDEGKGRLFASFLHYPPSANYTVYTASYLLLPVGLILAIVVCVSLIHGTLQHDAGHWSEGVRESLLRTFAILLIASPSLFRSIVPVGSVGFYRGIARHGIHVGHGRCIEELPLCEAFTIDQVCVQDEAASVVRLVEPLAKNEESDLISLAASLLGESDYHAHRAIVRYAAEKGIETKEIREMQHDESIGAGGGYKGQVQLSLRQSRDVTIGPLDWLHKIEVKFPKDFDEREEPDLPGPVTALGVASENTLIGIIWVEASIHVSMREAMIELGVKRSGKRRPAHLLSPDPPEAARAVARAVGASDVAGELSVTDKRAVVERYQNDLKSVCAVADPIHDVEVLREAHIGVAIPPRDSSRELDESAFIAMLPARSVEMLPVLVKRAVRARFQLSTLLHLAFVYHVLGAGLAFAGSITPLHAVAWSAVMVVMVSTLFRNMPE